jgi:hypothetical protein
LLLMVPGLTLPASLLLVLQVTRPCFTKHSWGYLPLLRRVVRGSGARALTDADLVAEVEGA